MSRAIAPARVDRPFAVGNAPRPPPPLPSPFWRTARVPGSHGRALRGLRRSDRWRAPRPRLSYPSSGDPDGIRHSAATAIAGVRIAGEIEERARPGGSPIQAGGDLQDGRSESVGRASRAGRSRPGTNRSLEGGTAGAGSDGSSLEAIDAEAGSEPRPQEGRAAFLSSQPHSRSRQVKLRVLARPRSEPNRRPCPFHAGMRGTVGPLRRARGPNGSLG